MATTRPTFRPASTAWMTAGNWDTGAIPQANEYVTFDEASNAFAVLTPTGGSANINMTLIQTMWGYTQDLGNSGTPLDIFADQVIHRGGGALYLASGAGGITDSVYIDSSNTTLAASLTGTAITDITCQNGRTVLESGLNAAATFGLTVGGGAKVQIDAGAGDASQTINVTNGTLTNDAAAASLRMTGGTATQDTAALVLVELLGGTLILNYRHITDGTAIISGAVEMRNGGTLDVSKRPTGLTITGPITLGVGGRVIEAYDGQISVTNGWKTAGGIKQIGS